MQRKLTAIQISEVRKALESLQNTISLLSRSVIGVGGRTYKLEKHLHNICEHGTTDGKPWVEPEPPIPPGYRKAEPDEWRREDVMFWSPDYPVWRDRPFQGKKFDPPASGPHYIVPIEPPLTDEDAKERRLCMFRDYEPDMNPEFYHGPLRLIWIRDDGSEKKYVMENLNAYKQARRATPQEIRQAGLDRPENPAKVEPCRGHDRQGPQ